MAVDLAAVIPEEDDVDGQLLDELRLTPGSRWAYDERAAAALSPALVLDGEPPADGVVVAARMPPTRVVVQAIASGTRFMSVLPLSREVMAAGYAALGRGFWSDRDTGASHLQPIGPAFRPNTV